MQHSSTHGESKVYVDALGKTGPYEQYLSSLFPDISFTVTAKADQKFKIVGAASVAAKVTRDAWIEGWVYEEHHGVSPALPPGKWVEEITTNGGVPTDIVLTGFSMGGGISM